MQADDMSERTHERLAEAERRVERNPDDPAAERDSKCVRFPGGHARKREGLLFS